MTASTIVKQKYVHNNTFPCAPHPNVPTCVQAEGKEGRVVFKAAGGADFRVCSITQTRNGNMSVLLTPQLSIVMSPVI